MMHDGAFEAWRGDDRPWDEYEWEAFLQEQDELTERYMELEARYRDLPDAEDRIAREMGWELPAAFSADADPPSDASPGEHGEEQPDDLDEAEPYSYEEDPLWRRAHEVAVHLHRALPVPNDGVEAPIVPELLTQVAMIAAKVAGGRSMGFSRDALGGNIANHKRAMQHTLLSLAGIDRAERAGALASGPAGKFRRELLAVRERLMGRIVELRQMFHSGQFIDD
jgi:hypothetical protein